MTYLELLMIVGAFAIFCLYTISKETFSNNKKIFLKTTLGSLIFAFPWFTIAIANGVWYFKKPLLGVGIFWVPLEELLFIVLISFIYTYLTIYIIAKYG